MAGALAEVRAGRAAEERRARLAVQEFNRKQQARDKIQKETQAATEMLNKRKRELLSVEGVLETRHAMKRFSPEVLGKGKKNVAGLLLASCASRCSTAWRSWALG